MNSDESETELEAEKDKFPEEYPIPDINQPGPSTRKQRIKKTPTDKEEIKWVKKPLQLNEHQLKFHGDTTLPNNVMDLETPYQFCCYFFIQRIS